MIPRSGGAIQPAIFPGSMTRHIRLLTNALSALEHLQQARALQEENVSQSERAFEGASLRYRAGSGDFLTVLEAQRTLYAARDQYSQYRFARFQAFIALCKALGGGWQAPKTAPKETP